MSGEPVDLQARLTAWLAARLPGVDEVRLEGLEPLTFGHSSETLLPTVVSRAGDAERRLDIAVRLRPPPPGLLEPYDLQRQFDVLTGLAGTDVRSPRALWIEPTGEVLGRAFFVMERLSGEVWEMQPIPPEMDAQPGLLRRMGESLIDQLAAIHLVDLKACGLDGLGDGADFLTRELERWASEMRRVQRGELPAMEGILSELRRQQPAQCPRITLVHGDPKPGNFAFTGDQVSAVYDWELAGIGDPLCDLGYLELLWAIPSGITSRPGSLKVDEAVARWEKRTGLVAGHRSWYRAMQIFKVNVIQLIGSMLYDAGDWDDPRAIHMAYGIKMMTPLALSDLGIGEDLSHGAIYPREERMQEAKRRLRAGA